MFWFAGDLRRMGDLLALRMDGSSPLPEGELGSERIGVRDGEVTSLKVRRATSNPKTVYY